MNSRFFLGVLLSTTILMVAACSSSSEAEKHNDAGFELFQQGRLEEAVAEFTKAIQVDPNFGVAYHNRGAAYGRLGQHPRAIQEF